jgi:hypothetical protein
MMSSSDSCSFCTGKAGSCECGTENELTVKRKRKKRKSEGAQKENEIWNAVPRAAKMMLKAVTRKKGFLHRTVIRTQIETGSAVQRF